MELEGFVKMLKNRPAPNPTQMQNLEKIKRISREFHREAGIGDGAFELGEHTLVLESAHQPNFLPHMGLIKKVFLLDFFADRLEGLGREPVCLFGFSDYNICTAKVMYQNKFPAMKTQGYEKIGFILSGDDRWRRLNAIKKPAKSEWEGALKRIEELYTRPEWETWLKRLAFKMDRRPSRSGFRELHKNLGEFIALMEKSYRKAKNLADVNAFMISHICETLQLDVSFFRMSDVQHEKVFSEESGKVLSNLKEFRHASSNAASKDADIRNYSANLIPFWYHCKCGANVELSIDKSSISGTCKLCGKAVSIRIEDFHKVSRATSPDAIGVNLIYSEGLGTALFVGGSGGSLKYGAISNAISKRIGFNAPPTIAWRGRDKYLGPAHLSAIYLTMKNFNLKLDDFLDAKALSRKIRCELANSKGTARETTLQNQLMATLNIFKTDYSMLDVFALLGVNRNVIKAWKLGNPRLAESNGTYLLEQGAVYKPARLIDLPDEHLFKIHDNLNSIEANFQNILEDKKNV